MRISDWSSDVCSSDLLRDLEVRLKTPLLNRRTRPARLTTAGLRILALADEILPQVKATERELQRLAAGRTGRLHLAIDCQSCFQWLLPALDRTSTRLNSST